MTVRSQQDLLATSPVGSIYAAYGCRLNSIDAVELFSRYETAGFMSMDKLDHLVPHLHDVLENWRHGMTGPKPVMEVVSSEDATAGSWASISCWRTTNRSWQTQHLVSYGNPLATRSVMLARQRNYIREGLDVAQQAWFQPTNRFSNRVFGSIVDALGPELGFLRTSDYLTLPLRATIPPPPSPSTLRVTLLKNGSGAALAGFASCHVSKVWALAEDLLEDDHELDALDQHYLKAGMRRYRRAYLAYRTPDPSPVGLALVHRGPLGFNFSFIENRCDVFVSSDVANEVVAAEVISALLARVVEEYRDFTPGYIPLTVNDPWGGVLATMGTKRYRRYSQSVWLRGGFEKMYQHVGKFYDRLMTIGERRGLDAGNWRRRSQFVEAEDGECVTER